MAVASFSKRRFSIIQCTLQYREWIMYFLKTDYLLQYLLLHVNGYSQCLKVRLLSWQGVAYIIMHQQSEGREPDRVE